MPRLAAKNRMPMPPSRTIAAGACFLLAALLTAGSATAARSAPVTLAFEAEINDVAGLGQESLPFRISPGDSLTGILAVDSNPQHGRIELTIAGVSLASERIATSVSNNTSFDDGPFDAQIVDVLSAGCGVAPSPDCLPARQQIGAYAQFVFRVQLELVGQGAVLDGEGLPEGPEVWNGFQLQRLLRIAFDLDGPESVAATAIVSDFRIVPEPVSTTTLCGAFLGASVLGTRSRRRALP